MERPCARTVLAAFLLCLAFGCGGPQTPTDGLPPGALLSARRADLVRLLDHLAALEGTPLAIRAGELEQALPACDEIEAQDANGDWRALVASLRCRTPGGPLEPLHAKRGPDALAVAWPLDAESRLIARLALRPDGDASISLELPRAAASGVRGLFLPGERAPGPGVLSAEDGLLHARVRPVGGLDVASLIPAGSQGDQLFRLKSRIFTGGVLDGTWELAVYLPEEGHPMPRAALALGFTSRTAAVRAMDAFLDELEASWPVHRSAFSPEVGSGACFRDLRILPGFAPCYVATDRVLVVGYNAASVLHALAGTPDTALGEAGGLEVDLARFPEADARLARARGQARGAGPTAWPWRMLRARGESAGERVHLRVELSGEAGA